MPKRPALHRVLKQLGIDALRPGQREVIESVLQGRDTLAVMPSGSGKSLCYQVPALILRGATIVVSPLIALMKDQADKMEDHGVEAAPMSSALTGREESRLNGEIRRAGAEIVFTTPERLATTEFQRLLRRNPIDIVVVDEAHCISQWGHDFRPAYLEIGPALRALGDPPLLALTATARPEVIEDIGRHLGRKDLRVVNTGVYRPNLHYAVRQVTSAAEQRRALIAAVQKQQGAGIVYAATVKAATAAQAWLAEAGEPALLYHGRLGAKERNERQDAFMRGDARVMVATNAFGMGIDKPDIRFVIHSQVPGSVEAYYQESGRAGRDGERADCLLLYYHTDRRIQRFLTRHRYPDVDDLRRVQSGDMGDLPQSVVRVARALLREASAKAGEARLREIASAYREKAENDRRKLERMTAYAQSGRCRWKSILDYFGEHVPWEHCGHCDNCARAAAEPVREQDLNLGHEAEEPALHPGDRVVLPHLGEGRVRSVAGDTVQVRLGDGSTRPFLSRYVRRMP